MGIRPDPDPHHGILDTLLRKTFLAKTSHFFSYGHLVTNTPNLICDRGNGYQDFYGNKELLPGSKALAMLDNVVKQLNLLPPVYRDAIFIAYIHDNCWHTYVN